MAGVWAMAVKGRIFTTDERKYFSILHPAQLTRGTHCYRMLLRMKA